MTIYGTARPREKFAIENAMALVGQVRQGCPSMAPLGYVQLKKVQKLLESRMKSKNENEIKNENSFLFSSLFLLSFFNFCFFFHFRICFFFFSFSFLSLLSFSFLLLFSFYFFSFLFLNFTMVPLGHHARVSSIIY